MKNFSLIVVVIAIAFAGCSQPKPVKTIENLKEGVKGETTASAKYAAFSNRAMEEGYTNIARLFEAASKAEAIHAANHSKVLAELGVEMEAITPEFDVLTTAENLQAAIDGETYETTTMYPQFLADASAEKVAKAEKSFTWAFDTEKKHGDFYAAALEALNNGAETSLPAGYEVCPVCGNTYESGNVDESCAFCQTPREKYFVF